MNIGSPAVNTANLPMALPLAKPIEIKNLQVAAEVKGREATLNNLSLQLFDGQVKGQAKLVTGSDAPPFTSSLTVQGVQLGPALEAVATTNLSHRKNTSFPANPSPHFVPGKEVPQSRLAKTVSQIAFVLSRDAIGWEIAQAY